MAEQMTIPGSDYPVKIRSLCGVALLPLVTSGIYYFVWYYKINKEMAALGRARGRSAELGESPGMSLLAVTLGAFIIVPPIISMIHTFQRIQATQRLAGDGDVINGWLGLVLYLVLSPALCAYMQSGLNESWPLLRAGASVAPPYPPVPPAPAPPPAQPAGA